LSWLSTKHFKGIPSAWKEVKKTLVGWDQRFNRFPDELNPEALSTLLKTKMIPFKKKRSNKEDDLPSALSFFSDLHPPGDWPNGLVLKSSIEFNPSPFFEKMFRSASQSLLFNPGQ